MGLASGRRWASGYYFLFYAATAAYAPFQVLYYQGRGLSGNQIGLIAAASTLISLWAAPSWTGFADARGRHRRMFVIATLGTVAFLVLTVQAGAFWLLVTFVSLRAFSAAALVPLIDNSVMAMLRERSNSYGRLRLWGSVGWGIFAPVAGWFVQGHDLRWAYWIAGGVFLFSLASSAGIPFAPQERQKSYWKGARQLLASRPWWLFLFVTFLAGMGTAVYNNYLFAYLEDLGASKTFMGVALSVATVSELPFFFFAGALLKRFKARGLFIVSLAAIALKCFLYWGIKTPLAVLPVQLLNGLAFSLLWSAGVSFARESAPPGLGATAQGMFGAMIFGFGGAAGGLLGGVFLGTIGSAAMYGVFGVVTLAGLLAYLAGGRILTRP
jgi:PPP family 3-phenylpropionic acid transporter